MTIVLLLMGVEISASNVPSLLSSAKDLIVINGIHAGDPNNKPTTNDDNGGKIQSVYTKLSIKNLNPIASNDKK